MTKEKSKTVFDHITHIRESKSPDYLKTLSESEVAAFEKSKYIILLGLGMDERNLESVHELYRRMEHLDAECFYKLCCKLIPKGKRFVKWIKAEKSSKSNPDLINILCKHFLISKREAYSYYERYIQSDDGLLELCAICSGYGLTEQEIERMITNE